MNEEENNNLYYNIEEDDQDPDQSPYNYASPDSDDEIDEESDNESISRVSAWHIFWKILFNPAEGWKTLRRSRISNEALQSACFYPLLALLALSKFSEFFYSVKVSLQEVVTQAIIAFVSYFLGYFCIIFILNLLLSKPVSKNFDSNFGKCYITIGLSTLALFAIIPNLLPMLWPILIFLPLWTIYLLYKGSRYFKLSESQVLKFLVLTVVSIIGLPLLIDWGMNALL